jgi:quinol monooxygenase YgiN
VHYPLAGPQARSSEAYGTATVLQEEEELAHASGDSRKYIIGWLTLRPGMRDEFMAIARPYVASCLKEEGCLFFEMNPSESGPDIVTLAECFADVEAHTAHLKTPEFQAFWAELGRLALHGRFENIFPDHVVPDAARFGGTGTAEVHYYE